MNRMSASGKQAKVQAFHPRALLDMLRLRDGGQYRHFLKISTRSHCNACFMGIAISSCPIHDSHSNFGLSLLVPLVTVYMADLRVYVYVCASWVVNGCYSAIVRIQRFSSPDHHVNENVPKDSKICLWCLF